MLASDSVRLMQNKYAKKQNRIFYYTRCITERVTNFRGPSPRHCASGQHSFFEEMSQWW